VEKMNFYITHIYQFFNLHYIRMCDQLDVNEPYDENRQEHVPLLDQQF